MAKQQLASGELTVIASNKTSATIAEIRKPSLFGNDSQISAINNSKIFSLKVDAKRYSLKYNMTGDGNSLDNITPINNTAGRILEIDTTATSNGTLTIEIPRAVLDLRNQSFAFSINSPLTFKEISSNTQARILAIDFPKGDDLFEWI